MTSTGRINYIDELKGFILCLICFLGCILFRTQLYMLLGKEKISFRECFNK